MRKPASRVLKDVVTSYAGYFANALLVFLTVRLLAQHLGPDVYGVTNLANVCMTVIAGLSEPAIGTSLVRLASRPGVAAEVVDDLVVAAIRLKLVVVGVLGAVAYLVMPWITGGFMHRPELTGLLRCCLVGGALLSLATFAGALFQLRGACGSNAATMVVAGVVRVVVVLVLIQTDTLNLQTAVGSMILMNVVQCAMGLALLRPMLVRLPWRRAAAERVRELVQYGKQLVVWLIAGTVHPRADTLLLSSFVHENRILGFYSVAGQLSSVVPLLSLSINWVMLPRISALRTAREMKAALCVYSLIGVGVLLLITPAALAAGPVMELIFGPSYRPAFPLFRILLFAAGAELALNPLSTFWHALNRPAMLSVLNVARLTLLVGIGVLAIPALGAAGAAWAVFGSTLVPLAVQGLMIWWTVMKRDQEEAAVAAPLLEADSGPAPVVPSAAR